VSEKQLNHWYWGISGQQIDSLKLDTPAIIGGNKGVLYRAGQANPLRPALLGVMKGGTGSDHNAARVILPFDDLRCLHHVLAAARRFLRVRVGMVEAVNADLYQ
jgi:hypothetical protein